MVVCQLVWLVAETACNDDASKQPLQANGCRLLHLSFRISRHSRGPDILFIVCYSPTLHPFLFSFPFCFTMLCLLLACMFGCANTHSRFNVLLASCFSRVFCCLLARCLCVCLSAACLVTLPTPIRPFKQIPLTIMYCLPLPTNSSMQPASSPFTNPFGDAAVHVGGFLACLVCVS